jgi:hypothetical protein
LCAWERPFSRRELSGEYNLNASRPISGKDTGINGQTVYKFFVRGRQGRDFEVTYRYVNNNWLCAMRVLLFVVSLVFAGSALSQEKPNMLVIWGDDIGFWNLSTNNMGMMGYETPNIDRIAAEGAKFTDYYGQ